jgi:hypothetical protein
VTRRSTAVLIFEGYADWEPAFALTGLRRWGKRTVTTYGYDRAPVTSMGGLLTIPNRSLGELDPAATELLVLPGGDLWTEGYPAAELHPCSTRLLRLRSRPLESAPRRLRSRGPVSFATAVISATGLAPAEFAVEIFTTLHAFSDDDIAQFQQMYPVGKTGRSDR